MIEKTDKSGGHEVRARLPGIFYRKPAPDQPNFKNPGDAVSVGDVLGLIEVMKTFHQVVAERGGVMGDFQVDNEAPIRAGQSLAIIQDQ